MVYFYVRFGLPKLAATPDLKVFFYESVINRHNIHSHLTRYMHNFRVEVRSCALLNILYIINKYTVYVDAYSEPTHELRT